MSNADAKHHRYDRAARDAWRDSIVDVVEGLLGHRLPPSAVPEQTQLEQGELVVDGLVTDADGIKVHVEFQSSHDPEIGLRMARYSLALTARAASPAPEQHLILLHQRADRPGLGTYANNYVTVRYRVVRLWEIPPERLLCRPGLARFAPLGQAPSPEARARLLDQATRLIKSALPSDRAEKALVSTADLASLYLANDVIEDILKRNDMPIDIRDSSIGVRALEIGREEGRDEGLREGQRDAVRRVLTSRFGDQAPTDRVSTIPDALLLDAIDRATTRSAADFTAWLDQLRH